MADKAARKKRMSGEPMQAGAPGADFLAGGGEMGALMRAFDWSGTPLGPPEGWPAALKTTLRLLLTTNHPMVLWWGPELIQFYNDGYRQTMGPERHPASLGQPGPVCWAEVWDLVGPEVEQVMSGRGATWHEDALVPLTRNGKVERIWWDYSMSPVEDQSGVRGALVICKDVTGEHLARERAQRQATLEQERSHRILQTLRDGFVLLDRDFRVLQINAAGLAMDGRPAEEIVGRIHWDVWPGSESNAAGRAYQLVMRERRPMSLQHSYDYFGREMIFDLYVYPYEDGIAILYRDITAQTRAAEELRSSEERFRTLITTMDEGYCVIKMLFDDAGQPIDYRFLESNRAFEEQTGLVQATGHTVRELVPNIEPHWIERYGRVAQSGEPMRMVEHSPSMGRWFDVYATPIGDARRHKVALLFKDITQQKASEASLRQLADDLSRANQRQSEFLATLAHELRNPLAPIRTGLDLMRLNPGNAQSMAKVRDMMERQTDHLIHLVNDLLDLARIRNGKIELKMAQVALKEIVAAAVETTLPAIEAKRHALRVAMPDEALTTMGDRNRLVQVIGNLLTNAAKYTPEHGSIGVGLRRDGAEALIEVSDNGIGIPHESLAAIFDIFTQVGWDATQGGLGIGLSLVKQLTEMHGGSVKADSAGPGQGSTFSVRLPILQSEDAAAAQPAHASNRDGAAGGLDILLADDNVDAVDITCELLALRGHRVRVAHDGHQALALARERLPQVALLDIGMPGMSGYELAAQLRRLPHGERLFLAAVTGWGTQDDKERSRAAGFDVHLTKPIDLDTLDRLLAEH
jgi:PAS domain S-box-containing protein